VTTLHRARIVQGLPEERSSVPSLPLVTPEASRRVAGEVAEAHDAGEAIKKRAQAEADALVAAARAGAVDIAAKAAAEAREAEEAKLAGLYLALQRADETRAERDIARTAELAVVLAERLLGAALALDPGVVAQLAQNALAEARGARRAVIEASPLDVATLRGQLDGASILEITDIRPDPSLGRGSIRIRTNIGDVDATLRTRLDRLGAALRDVLRS
jgi:flagellar biosynthesis/type III secretory pathway protein FliH